MVSSLNYGGAQKVISNITTTLPDYYIIDILLNSDKDIQYPYRGRIISLDVEEPYSRDGIIYQFKVFCKRLRAIRKLKKDNQYDTVVSILTSANVANVLCKTPECKTVITEVNLPSKKSFKDKYIIGGLTTRFYNQADHVVAETKAIADNLINNHGVEQKKICVIPNSISIKGINEEADKPLTAEEQRVFCGGKTFVTAGRMQYQKAQWHLIRAFSKVVEYDEEAKLVIFGEGIIKDKLNDLIRAYNLEKKVFLCGFTNELDKYVARCCAFVLPSMYEGMPTVLLQAMAVGIPCIVTDFFSGAREILGDENTPVEHIENILYTQWGIMTPVCSGKYLSYDVALEKEEEYLAEAMICILADDKLRKKYSLAVKERIVDFDNGTVIKKWMEVL